MLLILDNIFKWAIHRMGEPHGASRWGTLGAMTPEQLRIAAGAADIRRHYRQSLCGAFLVAATCLHVHFLFEGLAPTLNLWLWSGCVAAILFLWAQWLVEGAWQRLDDAAMMGRIRRNSVILMVALNVVIAASVWLLMPFGDAPLRLLMVLYLFGFVATQLLLAPATSAVAGFAVVVVLGSVALFFLTAGGENYLAIAIFVAGLGGALYSIRLTLNGAVRDAILAKMSADVANQDLAMALSTVAAARDAKTRFIAAASHDLAQPIAAARLFLESLSDVGDEPSRKQAADGVRQALGSASAQLELMLDHLRLEAGTNDVRVVLTNVRQLAADVAAMHRPAAAAAGMTVHVAGKGDVIADPVMLARALGNLVVNAIVHAKGERVLIGVRHQGANVRLWVIDDGQGVSEVDGADDSEPLFADYVQGRHCEPGGFGLGLSSVRRAAMAMGGNAGHDSRWRNGAAFWIDLPAAAA